MMASTGGLSRRRAAAASESSYTQSSSGPLSAGSGHSNTDSKIASDPRDLQMEDENKTQPRLTLMEEVLLLGLKDKQVRAHYPGTPHTAFSQRGRKVLEGTMHLRKNLVQGCLCAFCIGTRLSSAVFQPLGHPEQKRLWRTRAEQAGLEAGEGKAFSFLSALCRCIFRVHRFCGRNSTQLDMWGGAIFALWPRNSITAEDPHGRHVFDLYGQDFRQCS